MAIYTTLFTATDSELSALFGGWRQPLPAPRQYAHQLKFGPKKEIVVTTWDPGSRTPLAALPSLSDKHGRNILPPIMPPDGQFADYQRWLEEICAPLLRTLPHLAIKGITHFELQELGAVLVGDGVSAARFADCRENEGCVGSIQEGALPLLASATDEELRKFSARWCERLKEGRAEDSHWVLLRLRLLAKDAVSRNANLFSHTAV